MECKFLGLFYYHIFWVINQLLYRAAIVAAYLNQKHAYEYQREKSKAP